MRGKRVLALAMGAGFLLTGCGVGGDEGVVQAEAADHAAQSERLADYEEAAQEAEERAEQAEQRARRAEKRAEKAEAKAKAAAALEADHDHDDDALTEHMAQNPEVQLIALDMGWVTATRTERDEVCAGWMTGGEVRELVGEIMVEVSKGAFQRGVTETFLEKKCS